MYVHLSRTCVCAAIYAAGGELTTGDRVELLFEDAPFAKAVVLAVAPETMYNGEQIGQDSIIVEKVELTAKSTKATMWYDNSQFSWVAGTKFALTCVKRNLAKANLRVPRAQVRLE
jgi:hypothetical protein